MEEERKENLAESEKREDDLSENALPAVSSDDSLHLEENAADVLPLETPVAADPTASKFNKTHAIRLTVSALASAITMTFFGLSYYYFPFTIMAIVFASGIAVITLAFISIYKEWETAYKLSVTALYIAAIFLIGYFALNKSGLLDNIHSVDDFVYFVNNSGGVAEIIFVLANFLQVTIIPIPSTITTTAGALLFEGIWKPLYLTVIGLVVGSMFAFFLGRVFGLRFAVWLVGEKTINKYKEITKGRDKVVLFYMFIFPFFPDDFLCILAGMTNYSYLGFFLLQVVSRTLGTLVTILLTKGIVSIPLHGWWLLLWGVIIIAVIVLLVLTIKYSEKIEKAMLVFIDKITFGLAKKMKKKKEDCADEEGVAVSPSVEIAATTMVDPPQPQEDKGEISNDDK